MGSFFFVVRPFFKPFHDCNIHQDKKKCVKYIFQRDSADPNSKGVTLLYQTTSPSINDPGKDTVNNKEGDEQNGKRKIETAHIPWPYFQHLVSKEQCQ